MTTTSRKVFISILGTGNYSACRYTHGDFISSSTNFIQKATLEYLTSREEWTDDDIAYIFVTPASTTENWQEIPSSLRTKENKSYPGLRPMLERMELPFPVEPVAITEGGDEENLWRIFDVIYGELREGDRLYIDLTHGLRYLPMLLLVLCNYAKFLKGTEVVSATYGNWESKETNKPIVDLMPLIELQDWTIAASEFINNGRAEKLTHLTDEKLTPIRKKTKGKDQNVRQFQYFTKTLRAISENMMSMRGREIIGGKMFHDLSESAEGLDTSVIAPMVPLFEKIKESFRDFSTSTDITNGFVAARWCHERQLYQQSITILWETIKAQIAGLAGYSFDQQISDGYYQDLAAVALYVLSQEKVNNEEVWKLGEKRGDSQDRERRKKIVYRYLSNPLTHFLSSRYDSISGLRNDFNHAGFRDNALPGPKIPRSIREQIDQVETLVRECPATPVLINLSNHPSDQWSEEQLQAAQRYGEVRDLPFPSITPDATREEVVALVERYAEKIISGYRGCILTVHLMGEMTFCCRLVRLLQEHHIPCVASTTHRNITELSDGRKEVTFEFEAFREY